MEKSIKQIQFIACFNLAMSALAPSNEEYDDRLDLEFVSAGEEGETYRGPDGLVGWFNDGRTEFVFSQITQNCAIIRAAISKAEDLVNGIDEESVSAIYKVAFPEG